MSDVYLRNGSLTRDEIIGAFPHGPKAVLVDGVKVDTGMIVGHYHFDSKTNELFADHFPGQPIMMGVLMIEIIQQVALAGVAVGNIIKMVKAGGVESAKYHQSIYDGDDITITIYGFRQDHEDKRLYYVSGKIFRGNVISAEGLICDATFRAYIVMKEKK